MDQGDFDDVTWKSDMSTTDISRPSTATSPGRNTGAPIGRAQGNGPSVTAQVGRDMDPLDIAGTNGGTIECTVTAPIKENDGTKDAYMSYLVTTTVRFHLCLSFMALLIIR